MKKLIFIIFCAAFVFGVSQTYAAPKSYIIVFQDSVQDVMGETQALEREHGFAADKMYEHALKGFAAKISEDRLQKLAHDPRVAFVSEDREVSIDGQSLPTGIDRINAEPSPTRTNKGAGVQVAVIDTGIDLNHPDLKTNIVGGKNCSTGNPASYADGNGHGTHVAGTIAALDNGIGVVGVAPQAKLWAVRVLNNAGSGSWSSVICGIDFVASKAPKNGGPITVANMSLGGGGTSDNNCGNTNNDALHKALCKARDAGVTFVVAAGNDGKNANTSVPAAYDDAVITVSALADYDGQPGNDIFASFSNYGNVVDLGAPGVSILSTWKGGGYNTISGTSMATPHVTGAAALYIATHPGSAWTTVRDALRALGELNGFGHTDPSGLHKEPIVRVDTL